MFVIHHMEKGNLPALDSVAAKAETYSIGEALKLATGATKAGATDAPTYVAMQGGTKTAADKLVVYPVSSDMVFETTFAADGSAVNVGDAVTLHTDGLQVTATTASGVATVVGFLDPVKTAGSRVLVKFL